MNPEYTVTTPDLSVVGNELRAPENHAEFADESKLKQNTHPTSTIDTTPDFSSADANDGEIDPPPGVRHDDTDRLQPGGVSFPIIFNLDQRVANELEHEVIEANLASSNKVFWEVSVIDVTPGGFDRVVAKYVSRKEVIRPPKISQTWESQQKTHGQASTTGLSVDDDQDDWTGPVLVISIGVGATLPWTSSNKKAVQTQPETRKNVIEGVRKRGNIEWVRGFDIPIIPPTLPELDIAYWGAPNVVIKSPHIYHALSDLIDHDPWFAAFDPFADYELPYPYYPVIHFLPQMKELLDSSTRAPPAQPVRKNRNSTLERKHLQILYDFLAPVYQSTIVPCQHGLDLDEPEIAFDMVWYLFKPGTEVYVRDKTLEFLVARVQGVTPIQGINHEVSSWEIWIWVLKSDGAVIGRAMLPKPIEISRYEGMKEISSFEIYPMSIHDKLDGGSHRERAIQGARIQEKAFREGHLLVNDCNMEFSESMGIGHVIVDQQRGNRWVGNTHGPSGMFAADKDIYDSYDEIWVNEPLESPISLIIRPPLSPLSPVPHGVPNPDMLFGSNKRMLQLSNKNNPTFLKSLPTRKRDEPLSPPLKDGQLVLLYPQVLGFSLRQKIWGDVARLKEVERSHASLDNLVIGSVELQTIKALASQHNKPSSWAADFINGKGSGGVVLLHGPPGVGKTYTVEAIAQMLHLPLLSLTIADIGTAETQIESELAKWFRYAEHWKCVLLIDEADIFLERRQNRDLARNGLVSGLLFLTTNRVGQIDDAFISRIHAAIQYKNLSPDDLKHIWSGFFSKIAKEQRGKIQIAPDAKKWVLETFGQGGYSTLNGRDIRNAFQTAITLAKFEYEEDPDFDASQGMVVVVSQKHFERVLEMSHQFHNYLDGIRREDAKKRAHARGDRNDQDDDSDLSLPLRSRKK